MSIEAKELFMLSYKAKTHEVIHYYEDGQKAADIAMELKDVYGVENISIERLTRRQAE